MNPQPRPDSSAAAVLPCDAVVIGGGSAAVAVAAGLDAEGSVLINSHPPARVPGYCAGDAAPGLKQIPVGTGAAATAASAMHTRLVAADS